MNGSVSAHSFVIITNEQVGVYAASKRSMNIMTETLRLELQPFSVGVLFIVTSAVQTN